MQHYLQSYQVVAAVKQPTGRNNSACLLLGQDSEDLGPKMIQALFMEADIAGQK